MFGIIENAGFAQFIARDAESGKEVMILDHWPLGTVIKYSDGSFERIPNTKIWASRFQEMRTLAFSKLKTFIYKEK